MICYRDMTFCSFYHLCVDGKTCVIALTPLVEQDAEHWWHGPGAPICSFATRPECFKEVPDETTT